MAIESDLLSFDRLFETISHHPEPVGHQPEMVRVNMFPKRMMSLMATKCS
jgi:hypothetical protein